MKSSIHEAIQRCNEIVQYDRSRSTAKAYKNSLDLFEEMIGKNTEISMEHFIGYPAYLLKKGYSKSTIGVYLAAARYFLDWLVIEGYIMPGYEEMLRLKKAESGARRRRNAPMPRTPRKGDAEKMIQAVQEIEERSPRLERDIALIEFLSSTGCRNNEAAQLMIDGVDMAERSAVVVGKGSKERKVYFSASAAKALEVYWAARGYAEKMQPVFARHDKAAGKRVEKITTTSVRSIVAQVAERAGLGKGTFTPHYFRHAYAIKMLRETNNLAMVQDLLGHSTPNSTRVYAKIYPDELREAYQKAFD